MCTVIIINDFKFAHKHIAYMIENTSKCTNTIPVRITYIEKKKCDSVFVCIISMRVDGAYDVFVQGDMAFDKR